MYKIAIARPITTLMFVLALVFFGYTQIQKMPVAYLPNVDYPIVTITTNYDQGSTEVIESKITDKIEEAISGISGIDTISSNSSKGKSEVTAQFKLTKSIEEATNDVRDKVSAIYFPNGVEKPIVEKFSFSSSPIITLFLSTKSNNLQELMIHANEVIKPILQSIEGVGGVDVAGMRDKVIKIYPNTTLLTKYNIDLNELSAKIDEENIKKDGGRVVQEKEELNISIDSDAINVEQLENIKIKGIVDIDFEEAFELGKVFAVLEYMVVVVGVLKQHVESFGEGDALFCFAKHPRVVENAATNHNTT